MVEKDIRVELLRVIRIKKRGIMLENKIILKRICISEYKAKILMSKLLSNLMKRIVLH